MKTAKALFVTFLLIVLFTACGPVIPTIPPGALEIAPTATEGPSALSDLATETARKAMFAGDFIVWPLTVYYGDCKDGKETAIRMSYKPKAGADLAKSYMGKIHAVFTPFNMITKATLDEHSVDMTWNPEGSVFQVAFSTSSWPDLSKADSVQSRVEVETGDSTAPLVIFSYYDSYGAGISSLVQLKSCNTSLILACPVSIETDATSTEGAIVDLSGVTQSGGCPPVTKTCNPPAGSTFPVGVTTVICASSDSCGEKASCEFNVTVKSATPSPVTITCPSDVNLYATSASGRIVNYDSPTSGGGCKAPTIVCNPPSGSSFPTGITGVSCKATDGCSAEAACKFNVKIYPQPTQPPAPPSSGQNACSQYTDQGTCQQYGCTWSINQQCGP